MINETNIGRAWKWLTYLLSCLVGIGVLDWGFSLGYTCHICPLNILSAPVRQLLPATEMENACAMCKNIMAQKNIPVCQGSKYHGCLCIWAVFPNPVLREQGWETLPKWHRAHTSWWWGVPVLLLLKIHTNMTTLCPEHTLTSTDLAWRNVSYFQDNFHWCTHFPNNNPVQDCGSLSQP